MALQDLAGCFAAVLVFVTFSAKGMVKLRTLGVASNLAFVAYASMAGLWPIFFLHSVLLPMNVMRLRQAIVCRSTSRTDPAEQDVSIATIAANDNQDADARETVSLRKLALNPSHRRSVAQPCSIAM
jgi:hypothetical protein